MKKLKIGNITIENPILLAPMAGVSDKSYRKMVSKFSPDILMVSEMVSSNSQMYFQDNKGVGKNPKLLKMYEEIESWEKPLSVQIFGGEPELLAQSALINQNRGASIIDINMGCPVKKIVKSKGGSDLLREPERVRDIVRAVRKSITIPLTVKIRLGWDMENINCEEIAKICEGEGADMITVHGRTRSQLYSGTSNWAKVGDVKRAVSIPVICNGDIIDEQTAKQALEISGCDGLMIGRGSYGKPWQLRNIIHYLNTGEILPAIEGKEKTALMLEHLSLMIEEYGEQQGVLNFRKHASWYSKGWKSSAQFREDINKSKTLEEVMEHINAIISNGF